MPFEVPSSCSEKLTCALRGTFELLGEADVCLGWGTAVAVLGASFVACSGNDDGPGGGAGSGGSGGSDGGVPDASLDQHADSAGPDGETDAGPDAPDGSVDVTVDAPPDSGPDADSDAGPDGSVDAASDATVDASPDAESDAAVDATSDLGSDSGIIYGIPGPSCDGMTGTESQGKSGCSSILVPGGTFPMGRSENGTDAYSGYSDEQPEHDATVSDFYLDEYEVTVGRFRKFVEHTAAGRSGCAFVDRRQRLGKRVEFGNVTGDADQ